MWSFTTIALKKKKNDLDQHSAIWEVWLVDLKLWSCTSIAFNEKKAESAKILAKFANGFEKFRIWLRRRQCNIRNREVEEQQEKIEHPTDEKNGHSGVTAEKT